MNKPTKKSAKKLTKKSTYSPKKSANHKYIFVIGGVMSGVGKGIAVSSMGTLLTAKGYKVNLVKVDPYLNVDAGTMHPTEHGEVFVLNSGLETDQDMGNYERFLGRDLASDDYITSGMVYKHVIDKERALEFGGKCVDAKQIRDEIIHRIEHAAKVNKSDISIIEIGGTIGDYQNVMFMEAARVFKTYNPNDVIFMMVSYLPTPGSIGEMKTRPTQNAERQLASYGINTDFIIGRASTPIDKKRKEKIASACNIRPERVISAPDIKSIYDVPVNFEKDRLAEQLLEALNLPNTKTGPDFDKWKKLAHGIKSDKGKQVHIGVVGKYFNSGDFILSDAYLSVLEAIKYSGYEVGVRPVIHTINSRDFEIKNPDYSILDKFQGIIVPGGFGETGIEGKLNVIRYAREHGVPYFGLCYGMQLMSIEYARNVLGLTGAHTAEINPKAPHLIIDFMPEQKKKIAAGQYGGTMRLGLYPTKVLTGSIAEKAYLYAMTTADRSKGRYLDLRIEGKKNITVHERHRHRYEVNPKYIDRLEKGGIVFSGKSPDGTLMEIAELPRSVHPFFLGTQFHPEFMARPLAPHPLFTEFMKAAKSLSSDIKSESDK